MPSKSYFDFLELLQDVEELRLAHFHYSQGNRGRKKLGYLTRSAIVMLCASWERYNENILIESIDKILTSEIEAKNLSKYIKEFLSDKVKTNKNQIYPIELADNGWKNLWKGYAINETVALNTPNSENLNKIFKRFLGVEKITEFWHSKSISKIDEFIKVRGEIAHNGRRAKYVRFSVLLNNIDTIIENVIQIDYSISQILKNSYSINETWEENYYKKLSSYKK